MRAFIGVHRYAPLDGLYGDIGWLPSTYRRKLEMFRYWNRLVELDDERLTKRIFKFDYNSNFKNTWTSHMKSLFTELGILYMYNSFEVCNLSHVNTLLIQNFTNSWLDHLASRQKVRLYRVFKTFPTSETHVLLNLSPQERSCMAQLRLGILPIEVETGRFRAIPLENRICKLCNLGQVEDEKHLLFHCVLYEDERSVWFGKLSQHEPEFHNMSFKYKLCIAFGYCRCTAKYIVTIMKKRKQHLFNI
jgi:hypothetical protein